MSNELTREPQNQTDECHPSAAQPKQDSECTSDEVVTSNLDNCRHSTGMVSDPDFRPPVEILPAALAEVTVRLRNVPQKVD